MKRTPLLLLLLAPIALGGCQTIREHNPFRHREPQYKSAQQEQPLEVPPGMNQPPSENALAIPSAGSGATAARVAPPAAEPATGVAGAAVTAPAAAAMGAAGTSFTLQDTPASVYRRVGLALSRGDVGQVTAHDDSTLTYQVAVNTVVAQKPQGGFFHRLFHHSSNETVTGTVTVSVAASDNGSVVEASGNPDAATRVIALLQQRLQ